MLVAADDITEHGTALLELMIEYFNSAVDVTSTTPVSTDLHLLSFDNTFPDSSVSLVST